MGYGGGESIGEGDDDGGGGVGGEVVYNDNTEPALVSVSDSYSDDEEISVGDSGPSSSPTYTLTDYLSGYCPNRMVNDFGLRRPFYSKQGFKNSCCSPA